MAKNLTEVRLLAVPLENDYLHTLYFSSKSDQETYFKSKQISGGLMDNCTYQRKDHYIRFNKQMDSILKCNYVMYKNPAYSDKWFYAFVTKMEYIDDGRTDIYIETDVIQTWMFDYTVKPSFVEREHCSNDTVGLHTIPEGLETGEYITNKVMYNDLPLECGVILACTLDLNTYRSDSDKADNSKNTTIYNGIVSGNVYYYFDLDDSQLPVIVDGTEMDCPSGIGALNYVLWALAESGQSDAVNSIFITPKNLIELNDTWGFLQVGAGDLPAVLRTVKNSWGSELKNWVFDDGSSIPKPTKINGYTPRNKKLLTYPYSYLYVDNNAGANSIYNYELFDTDVCNFGVTFAITPGGSMRLIPQFYKGVALNYSEGLNGGKYPICSWNSDVYTNWLTQNSVNIGVQYASAGLSIAGGIASMVFSGGLSSGGSMGLIAGGLSTLSGVNQVASTVGEVYSHSKVPPQSEGNINAGDVTYSYGELTFTAYDMSIKKEYAQIIDGYFDMYGYKTNLVKTPAKNHRKNYWYTKTIDCNIDGAIPMDDLRKIKDCYNNGITFWKSADNIGNYSVDNSIV